jgi:very-short-patch-repair endonuclease
MILQDKFLEEVEKYCETHNITIRDGQVPSKHEGEIIEYIKRRLARERQTTARLEESIRLRMECSVGGIMQRLVGCVINSPVEEYLWDALTREELSFMARRQFEIGPYRIDIAFPNAKLAVECDGAQYHRGTELQLERDQKRDKYLARKGWRTLRIEGIAIRRDIGYCIERIKKALGIFTEVKNNV